ncbi:hypothetical protein ABTE74_20200, partial [Acinetobacter baumannii]
MRVALLGAEEPWIAAYCRRIMRMTFAEDRDLDNPEAVREALAELGLPADALLSAAVLRQNKEALRAQTERALHRGIFG